MSPARTRFSVDPIDPLKTGECFVLAGQLLVRGQGLDPCLGRFLDQVSRKGPTFSHGPSMVSLRGADARAAFATQFKLFLDPIENANGASLCADATESAAKARLGSGKAFSRPQWQLRDPFSRVQLGGPIRGSV